ncbi:MAG TPA: serine/threonine-protein kinase [Gemmataceae bacterium]|nr:serine/threonine-protein kinase [Gemmataceae bacterium]
MEELRKSTPSATAGAIQLTDTSPAGINVDAARPEADQPPEAATLPPPAPPAAQETAGLYDFLAPAQGPQELGRLGPYRVLKVIGAGGMGVVFQAEDPHLDRLVALKAMLPALASNPLARQRFLREAKAAAAIEHDHIIHINEVGEERGVPFLAMPLLKGEPLDDRLKREGKLPVTEVLRIGREVAEGLAAAHEHGLIHRDIKPANIWLEGSGARVKILDFGLARAVANTAHLTQSGVIVGTPAYMAPEQTRGRAVDHRADLFSLGCVLYQMATGEQPFKGTDTISILAALALDNPPAPRELDPNVRAALSDLVMQLLTKDPAGRPASAHAVAGMLEAMEHGQTGVARQSPVRGLGRQDDRRVRLDSLSSSQEREGGRSAQTMPPPLRWHRPWLAGLVALIALGACGYLFGPSLYRIVFNKGELTVDIDDPQVEAALTRAGVMLHDRTTDRKYGLKPGRQDLKAGDYAIDVTEEAGGLRFSTTEFTIQRGGTTSVKVTLERAGLARKVPAVEPVGEVRRFVGHSAGICRVLFHPDGRRALSSCWDGTLRLWDLKTGQCVRVFEGHNYGRHIWGLALSGDGSRAVSGSEDGTVRLWDVKSGKEVRCFRYHVPVQALSLSPDGRHVVSSINNEFVFWSLADGRELRRFRGHTAEVFSLAFSGDGRRVLSGSFDGTVCLWDVDSAKQQRCFRGHRDKVRCAVFSPKGDRILSGSEDGTFRLWDVDSSKELRAFGGGNLGWVNGVAFSRDGRYALSGSGDVQLWDVESGQGLFTFARHVGGAISCVAFSPDGRYALSGDWGVLIRLYRLPDLPSAAGGK